MSKKLHIDCSNPNDAETLCKFLEGYGYTFGYNHWRATHPEQRRAYSNMRFITIDTDKKIYSGSKGKSLTDNWVKFKNFKLSNFLQVQSSVNKELVNYLIDEAKTGIENRKSWIAKREDQIGKLTKILSLLYVIESNQELENLKYQLERVLR